MNANHDDRFDDAIRVHHAAALEHLSPRVRAQLAQRRSASKAQRAGSAHRGHGLRFAAAGFAALCALAIGLQFGMRPASVAGVPGNASVAAATGNATMLDEDPEFYAWLASSDAQQVAME